MRDWIGDTGDPHNGPLSCSPDIILRTSQIGLPQTPQQVYGEGSGTENSQSLSDEADPQQDNYLYLRVRNRGAYPAANVQVKVYWATVSTLPMPSDWKLIGSSVIPNVPPGNILTVSDAITWSKNDIPGPGHYCFIALIDSPDDPAPDPAVLTDWTSFLGYVSENNNVTWRNFNVAMLQPSPPLPMALVPAGPDSQDQYAALPFEITGPAGRGFEANVEICAKLPVGSKLWLEARSPLAKQLCDESLFNLESKDGEITSVRLNPHGLNALNPILRQPGVRMPLRLQVHIPGSSDITGSYECYVRQLYKNREIGRITWRLVKPLQKKARKPKKQQKGRSRKRNLK